MIVAIDLDQEAIPLASERQAFHGRHSVLWSIVTVLSWRRGFLSSRGV